MGDCLHWTVFLKIADVAQNFGLFLSENMYWFLQKISWATIWAIFSQTHMGSML
jgi:hypothetical protein